ncbi:unnamed protein product [Phytophthora fragariaefolia]|uniref:Unnamed protein product n=1 Tax=Phytophthora fragariaefolia TaxID=1490495 RepID=A0A9W6WT48_9STRA|nr:unnamed protein product [Phytophthora fragariaefolia]
MSWLARFQPEIDWLPRSVRRRAGYDVSEAFTHLLVAPSRHVDVVDRTSTTHPLQRESDGSRCVESVASIIGPVSNPPSRRLPFADDPVAQETLRDTGMTNTEVPCLEEGAVSSSETSASISGSRRLMKSKRNRSGRRPTAADQAPSSESVNVVEYSEDCPNRIRTVEVANPPSDATTITRLPGLFWKHFLRDLKAGEIEQVCLLTGSDQPAVRANWTLPWDQAQAIDEFYEGRRKAGHVRESISSHSSPTFCAKKATGGWRVVQAFSKLNDATIPAQTPISRKVMVLDTMSVSVIYSAIDLTDGS